MKPPRLSEYVKDKWLNKYADFPEETSRGIFKYTNFLLRPLKLGMFVPAKEVNGKWEVLEEPTDERKKVSLAFYNQELKEYQQALEKVIFKGFEVIESPFEIKIVTDMIPNQFVWSNITKGNTIEDIIHLAELNENGIKQAGL